jgi:hypothetical protein
LGRDQVHGTVELAVAGSGLPVMAVFATFDFDGATSA